MNKVNKMKVRGQRFYDMLTHQKSKFGLPDIASIVMEEVEIAMVDIATNEEISTTKLFLVIVKLNDGTFVSTKPLQDQDYAAYIAATLAGRVERFSKGS